MELAAVREEVKAAYSSIRLCPFESGDTNLGLGEVSNTAVDAAF